MTLKGEIDLIIVEAVNQNIEIQQQDKNAGKCLHCPADVDKILSAIKGRVPEEKMIDTYVEFGCEQPHDNYAKEKGFNEARNQFLNEVEG